MGKDVSPPVIIITNHVIPSKEIEVFPGMYEMIQANQDSDTSAGSRRFHTYHILEGAYKSRFRETQD